MLASEAIMTKLEMVLLLLSCNSLISDVVTLEKLRYRICEKIHLFVRKQKKPLNLKRISCSLA